MPIAKVNDQIYHLEAFLDLAIQLVCELEVTQHRTLTPELKTEERKSEIVLAYVRDFCLREIVCLKVPLRDTRPRFWPEPCLVRLLPSAKTLQLHH